MYLIVIISIWCNAFILQRGKSVLGRNRFVGTVYFMACILSRSAKSFLVTSAMTVSAGEWLSVSARRLVVIFLSTFVASSSKALADPEPSFGRGQTAGPLTRGLGEGNKGRVCPPPLLNFLGILMKPTCKMVAFRKTFATPNCPWNMQSCVC